MSIPRPLAALAILALLSAGCEDVSVEFMPLAAGNTWIYRVRSEGRDVGREAIRVRGPLGSGLGGLSSSSSDSDAGDAATRTMTRSRFFRVDEPGGPAIWGSSDRTVVRSSGDARSVVLLHPPFVGSGWQDETPEPGRSRAGGGLASRLSSRHGRTVYCKVIAREAVRTPAGWFFDCVVVRREAEDRSSVVTQWFAPGVGLVRWKVEQPGKPPVEWTLERYEIKYD